MCIEPIIKLSSVRLRVHGAMQAWSLLDTPVPVRLCHTNSKAQPERVPWPSRIM